MRISSGHAQSCVSLRAGPHRPVAWPPPHVVTQPSAPSVGTGVGTSMETDKKHAESKQRGRTIGTFGKAPRNGFHLQLLGPLAATRQGLAIAMPASRKVRALLGYLVLAPRPVLRSHLCELLWDVANDPRSELRWCLTKLRVVIDDARRRRLISDDQWVSIDVSELQVDAITF